MKDTKTIFQRIRSSFDAYESSIRNICESYKADLASAERVFKEEVYKAKKAEYAEASKKRIALADQNLRNDVSEELKALRDAANELNAKAPTEAFMQKMRAYHDFGIQMQYGEIVELLKESSGCPLSMRILQQEALKNGYKVFATTPDSFANDLANIEKAVRTPVMFVPLEHIGVGKELLSDVPVFRNDNSVAYYSGRPNETQIILNHYAFMNFRGKDLENMKARWGSTLIPSVVEITEEVKEMIESGELSNMTEVEIEKYASEQQRKRAAEKVAKDPGYMQEDRMNAISANAQTKQNAKVADYY